MKYKEDILKDDFLTTLLQAQDWELPSNNFTPLVMDKVQAAAVAKQIRSQKWHKLKIILLLSTVLISALYLFIILNVVWPYVSIWVPDFQLIQQYLSTSVLVFERLLISYFESYVSYFVFASLLFFAAMHWKQMHYEQDYSAM